MSVVEITLSDIRRLMIDLITFQLISRIPILVAPFDIDDAVPEPDEIAQAVRGLKNGKSSGPSRVRAEHLQKWVEEAYREEYPYQGNWDRVVDLVQTCFQEQQVSTQMSWSTVVLLPKGNGD